MCWFFIASSGSQFVARMALVFAKLWTHGTSTVHQHTTMSATCLDVQVVQLGVVRKLGAPGQKWERYYTTAPGPA